jgi:phage regulator Rha-like protein
MNDNLVSVNHGQIVTNSRQVAEHFEKQHQHVIRDIENLVDKAEEKMRPKLDGCSLNQRCQMLTVV